MQEFVEKQLYNNIFLKNYPSIRNGNFCHIYYKGTKIISIRAFKEKDLINNMFNITFEIIGNEVLSNDRYLENKRNLFKAIDYAIYKYLTLERNCVHKIELINKLSRTLSHSFDLWIKNSYWLQDLIVNNNQEYYFVPKIKDSERIYIVFGGAESGTSKLVKYQIQARKIKSDDIMHYRKMMADKAVVIEENFQAFLNDTNANIKNNKVHNKQVKYNSRLRKFWNFKFIKQITLWLIPLMLSAYVATCARQIFANDTVDLNAFGYALKETSIIFAPIIFALIIIYFAKDIVAIYKRKSIKHKISKISKHKFNEQALFVIHDINENNVDEVVKFLNNSYLFTKKFTRTKIKILLVVSTDEFKEVNKKLMNILKKRSIQNKTYKGYFKISNVCRNSEFIKAVYIEWLYKEIIFKHNLENKEELINSLKDKIVEHSLKLYDFSNIRLFYKNISFLWIKENGNIEKFQTSVIEYIEDIEKNALTNNFTNKKSTKNVQKKGG